MIATGMKIAVFTGIFALMIFGFTNTVPPIAAQDEPISIHYGDTINEQITDDTFEIQYLFEGQEGEVVIIRMMSDGTDAGLATPAFQVFSGERRIIDSTRLFTLSQTVAYAAFQLPEDGEILLVATRRDGETGANSGWFDLSLNSAAPMEANLPIEGSGSDSTEVYYVISPSGPFALSYTKTGGRFSPSIMISALRDGGTTEQAAEMSGMFLDAGTVSVTPDSGVIYLVRVGRAFLSPSTGDVEYTLTLSAREG